MIPDFCDDTALMLHELQRFGDACCLRTQCRLRAGYSPLSTGILYGSLQRVTIPEAVIIIIQFVFLKMSKVLLETC